MAISHLCISCGWDLARVRVRRDPHYGLPMVFCPECGQAAIRRRHPIHERWRAFLRLKTSLIALLLQLAAAAFFVSMVTASCIELAQELEQRSLRPHLTGDWAVFEILVVLLAISLGTWFTAGLHHWRRWVPWLVCTLLLVVLLSSDCVIGPALSRIAHAHGLIDEIERYRFDRMLMRTGALAIIMVIALLGIPLGHLMVALHRQFFRWCWRARRRRLRARRFAQ